MKQRRKLIGATFIGLTLIVTFIYGLKFSPALAGGQIQAAGTLQAPTVKVTAQASGVINQTLVNEGDLVSINQLMAKLENLDMENAVFKAEAELEVANARLKQLLAGVKPEDRSVLSAQVSGQQAVVTGLQKTLVEVRLVTGRLQGTKGEIGGALVEHLTHLDKITQEHAGHQNQPGHVHQAEGDGEMGMDCAQLLAEVGNINKVLSQINQLGSGSEKLDLKIGGSVLEAQVAMLQAETGNLENKLAQAQKELNVARAQLAAANTGPRQEDVDIAHAQVKQAQVNLELAKRELARNMILAPVNGLVLQKEINSAQFVNPGIVAFTMADLDNMWTEVVISPPLSGLQVGSRVEVTVKQVSNKQFLGGVTTLGNSADGTGQKVRIKVDNTENLLKPGMDAQVIFGG